MLNRISPKLIRYSGWILTFALFIEGGWGSLTFAEEQFDTKEMTALQLTEKEYLNLVLEKNDSIRQQKIDQMISQEGINNAQSIFEPKLVLNTEKNYGFEQNDTEEQVRREYKSEYEFRNTTYSSAIKGLLPTGTQYSLFYDVKDPANSLQNLEDYGKEWTTRTGIELTQPLLKNFGLSANRAAIALAEDDLGISTERLTKAQMVAAYQAQASYAALQQAQQGAKIEKNMLELENERVELMKSLANEGRITEAVLHLTRSQALRREARVNAAYRQLRKVASEVRRLLIGADNPQMFNVVAVDPVAPPTMPPEWESRPPAESIQQRPELKEASLVAKQEDTRLGYARNQALYELNLRLRAGKSGLGSDFSRSNDELDSDYDFWTVGAVLTIPLGGAEGKSKVAAAELRRRKAQEKRTSLEMLLKDEILAAQDNVTQSYREMVDFQNAVSALESAYRENENRFKAGKLNRLDLLGSQLELIEARRLLSEKIYENRRASLELKLADGRILESAQR